MGSFFEEELDLSECVLKWFMLFGVSEHRSSLGRTATAQEIQVTYSLINYFLLGKHKNNKTIKYTLMHSHMSSSYT